MKNVLCYVADFKCFLEHSIKGILKERFPTKFLVQE